jgi:hypothetical protein
MGHDHRSLIMMVWGAAIVLKLIVPHRFGRVAHALRLGTGRSGLILFGDLAHRMPDNTLFLLVAGGPPTPSGSSPLRDGGLPKCGLTSGRRGRRQLALVTMLELLMH